MECEKEKEDSMVFTPSPAVIKRTRTRKGVHMEKKRELCKKTKRCTGLTDRVEMALHTSVNSPKCFAIQQPFNCRIEMVTELAVEYHAFPLVLKINKVICLYIAQNALIICSQGFFPELKPVWRFSEIVLHSKAILGPNLTGKFWIRSLVKQESQTTR